MLPFVGKKSSSATSLGWKRRWFRRIRRFIGGVILLYLLILLIGLIPVNNDFKPATQGIEVFITSNGVHADLIVPIQTDLIDWRDTFPEDCFADNTSGATHIAISWGDKGLFMQMKQWADFKISIILKALFYPSPSYLHVVMQGQPRLNENVHSVIISKEQYARMVQVIQGCYKVNKVGKPILIPDSSYHQRDAFCEAHGKFHCLNTCNSWVGSVMRKSGIKAPLLTPLPKSMFMYLPD